MTVEKTIAKFTKSIDHIKFKINTLLVTGQPSTAGTFEVFSSRIKALSEKLSEKVEELGQFYLDKDLHESEDYLNFVQDSTLFEVKIRDHLDEIAGLFPPVCAPSQNVPILPPREDFIRPHLQLMPKLKCPTFSGNSEDKFAFKNFLSSFESYVSALRSDAEKLQVLKGYLSGYPASVVSTLSISDENYARAIDLLKAEFLDLDLIKSEIFDELISEGINGDSSLDSVRQFLTKIKANLCELQSSHDLNFYERNTPGADLIAHLVFKKLPSYVKGEMIRVSGTNYPPISFILNKFSAVLKTLESTRRDVKNRPVPKASAPVLKKPSFKPTLQNFQTENTPKRPPLGCRFCSNKSHQTYDCLSYPSTEDRIRQCKELRICHLCASNRHATTACKGKIGGFNPCRICKLRTHFAYLCPDRDKVTPPSVAVSSSRSGSDILLPLVEVTVSSGNRQYTMNCLLDSGSQRSYFSGAVAEALDLKIDSLPKREYQVKTFLGSDTRVFGESSVRIKIGGDVVTNAVLFDKSIDLNQSIRRMPELVKNVRAAGFNLAADFDKTSGGNLVVEGLVGMDVGQFVEHIKIKCLRGTAWKFSTGIAPVGSVDFFLDAHSPSAANTSERPECSFSAVLSEKTFVNFVLNPKETYADPLESVFEDSWVERKVDNLFSVESLGISEDSLSDYDQGKIQAFKESILFKDGSYYVNLPWDEDKLSQVPANHSIALKVLARVTDSLKNRGLFEQYSETFQDQEREGIIERFSVSPKQYSDFIWIPHRPVVKDDGQSTTKIRPVFNCSLKVRGAPSLNEAVYPGVNLLTNMLDLLLYFRSNRNVFLADIRKAFLMVKLRSETDKNKFCFFWKEGDRLVTYRYNTLIFGFVASPFILNYLIQFHLEKFSANPFADTLKNKFYVDNLLVTSDSSAKLLDTYRNAVDIMAQGNFALRSCNSNSVEIRDCMVKEGTFVEHDCDLEKLLGYRYDVLADTLKLSDSCSSPSADTKRKILAQIAGVFDPLSLCLPVTIRGRLLLRDLWRQKLGWDDQVPSDIEAKWKTLSNELGLLKELEFPRYVFSDFGLTDLYIFCDASKVAYGCTFYVVQEGKARLLFAKAKVAPSVSRSLPTLELLAVFLAMKCFKNILKAVSHLSIGKVYLAVDAQVVLAWLLSSKVNAKNVFVANRLKDINVMKEEFSSLHDVVINFRYVPTQHNPADLITRGLSLKKFQDSLDFWIHGPSWLCSDPVVWPVSDLKCLSNSDKEAVQTAVLCTSAAPGAEKIIQFDRFPSLFKIVRVMTFVFRFINRIKHSSSEPARDAKLFLIKAVQNQYFQAEKEYLQNPTNSQIPDLVKNLALFIDQDGIIRSSARIGKALGLPYEVRYPMLLPKYSHFTGLVVKQCHQDCLHLGIGATLTKLRMAGYWIPRARQSVKHYISSCFICRRCNALAFKYPKLTNLPKHRVNLIRPFLHTGIDFTGHLWTKCESGTQKNYLLVFTCLNVRAVHVELLPDMSAKSFVLALIRFCNIYGVPENIYSDNARTFVSGCNVVKQFMHSEEFQVRFGNLEIRHLTIPLYAPWMGSIWERMIRTVKTCLSKSIGRATLTFYELLTLISDVQRAVNSRPLTYRSSSDSNIDVITPLNFLNPYNKEGLMLKSSDEDQLIEPPNNSDINKSLELRDNILQRFHTLFYEEYLLSLREQCRDLYQDGFENKIQVDDIVLIKNPSRPRAFWQLGRVLSLIVGDDGCIRSVKVKRGDGSEVTHAVSHLYPMELSLTHNHRSAADTEDGGSENPTTENLNVQRPRRSCTTRRRANDPNDPYLWY